MEMATAVMTVGSMRAAVAAMTSMASMSAAGLT
jgi:hypothetical protein